MPGQKKRTSSRSELRITKKMLASFRSAFQSKPRYRIAMNAATQGNLEEVALNRRVVDRLDWHFSHEVPMGGVTAQNNAGTCWIYAGLNWLRKFTMKKTNTECFLYSQNYLAFWDKLEKSNRFLQQMIDHVGLPLDDRKVHHLLRAPVSDGGDWLLLSGLIAKYGVVPQAAMSDTVSLANSALMNKVLGELLRRAAANLRRLHQKGEGVEALQDYALKVLEEVHRVLCILFGEPPEKVDVVYRDKGGKFRRHRGLSPKEVFKKFVGIRLSDYVHLVVSPLPDTPYYRTLSLPSMRAIEGLSPGVSLNVPIEVVRKLAVESLKEGQAVHFDCEVTEGLNRKRGVLDLELYDYELLFDVDLRWDRSERMAYLQQRPTHSMVFIGVDLHAGKPTKWKVENSWGDAMGEKGLFQLSDSWFQEHVFGITVHRKMLGKKLTELAKQEPIELAPWHTLA